MKKKNLIILLLIPFIISLIGVVTFNISINLVASDIIDIIWNYNDVEGFKVSDNPYELKATGYKLPSATLAEGNDLTWSVVNKNSDEYDTYAKIIKENGKYYLYALKEGEVNITCSNEKQTVFKTMSAIIYENGAILVNSKIKSSQNNIDDTIYYGEYDLNGKNKQKAAFDFNINVLPNNYYNDLKVKDISNNIIFDIGSGKVNVISDGNAFITLTVNNEYISDVTIKFKVVKDGVNVYTYDDLLNCTNYSENGEIVVLRKSFDSLTNYNNSSDNNVELFGKYNSLTNKYSFENEVYRFKTTYNKEYINQWNEFASKNKDYSPISDEVLAALHVQKDFYGNGYTLNFHNLTYPYLKTVITDDSGNSIEVPTLSADNLFKGPLSYYTLGDPNALPLITAFGQDNVGMYVTGENVTINDVNIRNCDLSNSLSNFEYVGTVLDVYGNNITIKNSRLSNGKNVMRSFSSMNTTLKNSILSNSYNFLLVVGANEYKKIDESKTYTFIDENNTAINSTIKDFLAPKASGDNIMTSYISGNYSDVNSLKSQLKTLDSALNDKNQFDESDYKSTINIDDTMFYRSGIASITLESYFNGPYLYQNSPTLIGDTFAQVGELTDKPIVPLEPKNISGMSYPSLVNISGNTRFYDYKEYNSLDISGLIKENISSIVNSILDKNSQINIDTIFPIKPIIYKIASQNTAIYNYEGKAYINIPIIYYGGGLNLSKVKFDNYDHDGNYLTNELEINLLNNYLDNPSISGTGYTSLMIKTVTTVTGLTPFKFMTCRNNNALFEQTFNKAPTINDLKDNLKGDA